jgi:hypothetical protein
MARTCILLLLLCLAPAACRNAPAAAREDLRRDVEEVTHENRDELRVRLRATLLGGSGRLRDPDPHLRATAAQGLGKVGDAADSDVLLEALSGALADENAQVRMECAIALGKLAYARPSDERRDRVIMRLRDRTSTERDEGGRLLEREYMVRLCMVNSLILLGGRASAAAVHRVASRLVADMEDDAGARVDISDKGLLDRCLEGLLALTGVERAKAEANRRETDSWQPHLSWWATQISRMPEG